MPVSLVLLAGNGEVLFKWQVRLCTADVCFHLAHGALQAQSLFSLLFAVGVFIWRGMPN